MRFHKKFFALYIVLQISATYFLTAPRSYQRNINTIDEMKILLVSMTLCIHYPIIKETA